MPKTPATLQTRYLPLVPGAQYYQLDCFDLYTFEVICENPKEDGGVIIRYKTTRYDGADYARVSMERSKGFFDEYTDAQRALLAAHQKQVDELQKELNDA